MTLTPVVPSVDKLTLMPLVTAMQLRAEQKRVQACVREALVKAEETCLALSTKITSLECEIVVLKSRLESAQSVHIAALKARDEQIAALQAQVLGLQSDKAAAITANKTLASSIKAASDAFIDWGMWLSEGGETVRLSRIFRADVLRIVGEHVGAAL